MLAKAAQQSCYRAVIFVVLCGLLGTFHVVHATDYTSTNFILRDPVITVEGGKATSTSFELLSSTGQTIIGENTSSNFIHRAGFLYFPAPVAEVTPTPSPVPSGGGTTGIIQLPQVNFSGRADPGDTIFLLTDAQLTTTTHADLSGRFFIRLVGLSPGTYIFGLYAENNQGKRSAFLTFPVEVFPTSIINITDIFFGPVIPRDIAEAPCTVDYNGDGRVDLVDFSVLIFWFEKTNIPLDIDCNGDGKADIVDFSIMAYYWTG